MAGTTVQRTVTSAPNSAEREGLVQLNKVVNTDLPALRAGANLALYMPLGNPTFAIDTNFDVKNTEPISYVNGGTLKTLADNTSFDTGTAKTIPTTKWAAALLSVAANGTATLTWTASTYDSEALAIAALTSPGATHTLLGYVTVQAAGATWTAGTDALTTGTGGTPANATNYYNSINPNSLVFGGVDAAGDLTAAAITDEGGDTIATY